MSTKARVDAEEHEPTARSEDALHLPPSEDGPRLTGTVLWRSCAAAIGATAGVLVAIPLGAYLTVTLFESVGVPLMESVIAGAPRDMPPLERVVAFLSLGVAALVIAVDVVVALVAPVFVVVPLVVTAIALRLAGGGDDHAFSLAAARAGGRAGRGGVADDLGVRRRGRFLAVAGDGRSGGVRRPAGDGAGKPGPANQPAEAAFVGSRWKRLGVAWLVLLAVAVVGIAVLVRLRMGGPLRPA